MRNEKIDLDQQRKRWVDGIEQNQIIDKSKLTSKFFTHKPIARSEEKKTYPKVVFSDYPLAVENAMLYSKHLDGETIYIHKLEYGTQGFSEYTLRKINECFAESKKIVSTHNFKQPKIKNIN
jgi:hypothetical protein